MKITQDLRRWCYQNYPLVLILALAVFLRFSFITPETTAFKFDHGKDSLAIADMIINLEPKFVGPWTSIPGLRFGPGWYYLLAPSYVLGQGHPMAPVYWMAILGIIQTYLWYRFYGWQAALISTTSVTWLGISQSAWNPFPMTLISLLLLIMTKYLDRPPITRWAWLGLIGFVASLGFHFSTAYAIFYVPILLIVFAAAKVEVSWRNVLGFLVGFGLPFVPQLLFELKHNFVQTQAVWQYILGGQASDGLSWQKVQSLLLLYLEEFSPTLFTNLAITEFTKRVFVLVLATCIAYGVGVAVKKQKIEQPLMVGLMLGLPAIGYFFLHFNIWYLLGAVPAMTLLAHSSLKALPKMTQRVFVGLVLFGVATNWWYFMTVKIPDFAQRAGYVESKLAVINQIRDYADGRPFAVYHHVPPLYDYEYQYLYLWQAWHGQQLPVEFTYQPGESIYAPEKATILAKLYPEGIVDQEPELLFWVIEQPESEHFFLLWEGKQLPMQEIERWQYSPEIEVRVGRPVSQLTQ